MAITVFLAGVTSSVDSFIADATVKVDQKFSNQITEFTVDKRNKITDHVFNNNPKYTIEGVVTNHPVTQYDSNIIGYDGNRVENADRLLRQLWQDGSVFTILTEYADINYCILSDYESSFTADSSEALNFTISVEQVRFAETQFVTDILPEELQTDSLISNDGAGSPSELTPSRSLPALKHLLSLSPSVVTKYASIALSATGSN